MEPQTPHSWVSVTAQYTAHVWQRHGLSRGAYQQQIAGRSTYWLLSPIALAFRWIAGVDIEAFLIQRHIMIDAIAAEALASQAPTSIIEIAAGYAERGQRLLANIGNDSPHQYIEMDLPEVIASKAKLTPPAARHPRHQLVACDILARDGAYNVENLITQLVPDDHQVLIITEGLVHYFDLDVIASFWQRLRHLAERYQRLRYVCDLVPYDRHNPGMRQVVAMTKVISCYARNKVPLHFGSPQEVQDFFTTKVGFHQALLHHPDQYQHLLPARAKRGTPYLRIVEATAATNQRQA